MSLLTDQEIEELYFTEVDNRIMSFAHAIEAAILRKLATVSVEPKPVNESGSTMAITRWMTETPSGWVGSWDKDAIPTFAAAARVQTIEEVLDIQRGYNKDNEDMREAIRALIGANE